MFKRFSKAKNITVWPLQTSSPTLPLKNTIDSAPVSINKKSFLNIRQYTKRQKILIGATIGVVILIFIFILITLLNKPKVSPKIIVPQPVTLKLWSYTENADHYKNLIDSYQASNPLITIDFQQRDASTYKSDLEQRLKIPTPISPDILEVDAKDLNLYKYSLISAPDSIYTPADYAQLYYPHMQKDNVINQSVYGIPTGNDGLIIAYNTDLVKKTPPTFWIDFINYAESLTKTDPNNSDTYKVNGLSASNDQKTLYLSEIAQLLIFQNKQTDFYDDSLNININSNNATDALNIYGRLVNKKLWDMKSTNSLSAFTEGHTAFAFIKAKDIYSIQSKNPKLNFKTTTMPIISEQKYWSSYTSFAVNGSSVNSSEAWKFIKYISSESSVKSLYATATDFQLGKKPYALKSLSQDLKADTLFTPVGVMAPNMVTWLSPDHTQTNALFTTLMTGTNTFSNKDIDLLNSSLNTAVSTPSFP